MEAHANTPSFKILVRKELFWETLVRLACLPDSHPPIQTGTESGTIQETHNAPPRDRTRTQHKPHQNGENTTGG